MSSETSPAPSVIDPYKYLKISLNPDGTLNRGPHIFTVTPANPNPDISSAAAVSKDIPINKAKQTWARIFLPQQTLVNPISSKLPLLIYFHGGGFIVGSPDLRMFHEFCSNIASHLPVIVLSISYRLGPEHRLPAAYDDAMEALHWVKTIQDVWIRDYADFSNCFLMGSSAGGNLVYRVALRAAEEIDDLLPLKIQVLILHQPFFGGVQRTESEIRLMNDPFFPPCVSDLMWELSLPVGVDRDHEYCNPMAGDGVAALDKIKRVGWRVLVTGSDGDQLIDRQIELVKVLEKNEIQVVSRITEGDFHGFEFVDSSKAKELNFVLKNLLSLAM